MLGIKPDENLTAAQLLEEITPVFYGPDLISNEEIGFPETEEEAVLRPAIQHEDNPLMAALKASIEASNRDLRSIEAEEKYQAFYALLVEDIEATTKALEEREVALSE
jgi:type VI protein secretion system component VasF